MLRRNRMLYQPIFTVFEDSVRYGMLEDSPKYILVHIYNTSKLTVRYAAAVFKRNVRENVESTYCLQA